MESTASNLSDRAIFNSPQAEKLFKKTMIVAPICMERGMEYPGNHISNATMNIEWIRTVFEKRKWEWFADSDGEGCSNLVREFYANAVELDSASRARPTFKSFARGEEIDYSPDAIRETIFLPSETAMMHAFGQNGPDYHYLLESFPHQGILQTICGRPDADWIRDSDGKSTGAIYVTDVKPEVRVWAFYFSDSMIPTLNKSELGKELIVFLYCILNKHPIDLARIISSKIHDIANVQSEDRCLGYPLLINELLRVQLNKKFPAVEMPLEPNPPFTLGMVYHLLEEQRRILREPRMIRAERREEVPPVWAVKMQHDFARMTGCVLRRVSDLQFNVQALAGAINQNLALRNNAPYSAFEQHLMDVSHATEQENHDDVTNGGDPMNEF